jgi:hypothetical protein
MMFWPLTLAATAESGLAAPLPPPLQAAAKRASDAVTARVANCVENLCTVTFCSF